MRSLYTILHTCSLDGWGDIENRIFNESVWMEAQGHRILMAASPDTPLFDRARDHGFTVFPISFKRRNALKVHAELRKIFQAEQPHVLNCHGMVDARTALPAAAKSGVPCRILSCHTSTPIQNSWYNRLVFKKWSHYVFTSAPSITQEIQRRFKLKGTQIFTIPNGVDAPSQLPEKSASRKALAKKLGLDGSSRFIGYPGWMGRERRVDVLIRAFARIQRRIPHHLILAGEAPQGQREELEHLIRKLKLEDRVHLMETPGDPWALYRGLDCTAMASQESQTFESIPQCLMEAMYASCPVVAPETGGITDLVEHKVTGLLFGPGDADGLAEMICRTLEHPAAARERIHDARHQIRRLYTVSRVGRDIIRIYRLQQVWLDQKKWGRVQPLY